MADSMNAEQEVIRLGADDLYGDNFVTTVWHSERTFYNTLGVAKWCMSRRVRECDYKTVITGEGADELFAGYPAFRRDMILYGTDRGPVDRLDRRRKELEDSNRLFRGAILAEETESHAAFEQLCGFTPSWIQPWLTTLREVQPLFHPEVRSELADYDPIEAIAAQINPIMLEGRHPLDKAQYTWVKTMLEGQILNWGGDRVDMANSMESRPAFLDHHLAEAAAEVPPDLRIRDNREKWVLREAVKGVLPRLLYNRQKFAFMAPPAHTEEAKRLGVENLIKTYLSDEALERAALFDPSRIAEFLSNYRRDKEIVSLTRKDIIVNQLLCLQILHNQFIENNQPSNEDIVPGFSIGETL
jgi:asparagine synthase (glutamine-hydrolysing)